jgi:uncharacterized protein
MANEKRNALMLFTKAPKPGVTKTRLTTARGGFLTPQEAADFYRACLLDVTDIAFHALQQCCQNSGVDGKGPAESYDFIVSSSPAAEQASLRKLFDEEGPWPASIRFINDVGANFDEHFYNGYTQLFELGYQTVVSVGGDLPTLPATHILQAFQWLSYFGSFSERGGLVLAPCQECGVSLVGMSAGTPLDFTGIFYNMDGVPALDGYITRAEKEGIPTAMLDAVADIDDARDLAHSISVMRSLAYASQFQPDVVVPRRTLAWIAQNRIVVSTPPNLEHDPREQLDAQN